MDIDKPERSSTQVVVLLGSNAYRLVEGTLQTAAILGTNDLIDLVEAWGPSVRGGGIFRRAGGRF